MSTALKLLLPVLLAGAVAALGWWWLAAPPGDAEVPHDHAPDPPGYMPPGPSALPDAQVHPPSDHDPIVTPPGDTPHGHPHPTPGEDPTECPMACDQLVACAGTAAACPKTPARRVLGACVRGCGADADAARALNAASDCGGRLSAARAHLSGFDALCPAP
jgi:hypothetical protein